jgi:hypothetical protein
VDLDVSDKTGTCGRPISNQYYFLSLAVGSTHWKVDSCARHSGCEASWKPDGVTVTARQIFWTLGVRMDDSGSCVLNDDGICGVKASSVVPVCLFVGQSDGNHTPQWQQARSLVRTVRLSRWRAGSRRGTTLPSADLVRNVSFCRIRTKHCRVVLGITLGSESLTSDLCSPSSSTSSSILSAKPSARASSMLQQSGYGGWASEESRLHSRQRHQMSQLLTASRPASGPLTDECRDSFLKDYTAEGSRFSLTFN